LSIWLLLEVVVVVVIFILAHEEQAAAALGDCFRDTQELLLALLIQ
jgi:hypothetical protein